MTDLGWLAFGTLISGAVMGAFLLGVVFGVVITVRRYSLRDFNERCGRK